MIGTHRFDGGAVRTGGKAMTDEHRLSRRAWFKSIAASSALLGGVALGASGVSADDGDGIEDDVVFSFERLDPCAEMAEFYVHHARDTDLTFTYYVSETGEKGTITVEDSLATAGTFWVKAPKGVATVTLYYKGRPVGAAASHPDAVRTENGQPVCEYDGRAGDDHHTVVEPAGDDKKPREKKHDTRKGGKRTKK
ncbi:hypothetical protein B1756_16980 [Natrarchaeobaculum aegyptiacum]|uniref:Uncharacterized protein n=1 Tax=Natrarchaeobaculum aegyptiacum TaxID=745377 RepID=A0A2Z2HVK6_9EURY|nr:hypothetical protein B1756_16980 [Natrarchaeobaculum aegyptiacum]